MKFNSVMLDFKSVATENTNCRKFSLLSNHFWAGKDRYKTFIFLVAEWCLLISLSVQFCHQLLLDEVMFVFYFTFKYDDECWHVKPDFVELCYNVVTLLRIACIWMKRDTTRLMAWLFKPDYLSSFDAETGIACEDTGWGPNSRQGTHRAIGKRVEQLYSRNRWWYLLSLFNTSSCLNANQEVMLHGPISLSHLHCL